VYALVCCACAGVCVRVHVCACLRVQDDFRAQLNGREQASKEVVLDQQLKQQLERGRGSREKAGGAGFRSQAGPLCMICMMLMK